MTKLLFDNFDMLAESPGGVDKLRKMILQMAVQGKLVPQDPNDEPASVLVEKIREVKTQVLKRNIKKKPTELPVIEPNEEPFELPNGWQFVRLGDLSTRIGSGSTPRGGKSVYTKKGIPFLRSQNIWNDGLRMADVAYIPATIHQKMANTVVNRYDILLNITGASLGRCTVFPDGIGEANVSQHVSIIRPVLESICKYLHLCILSPYTQELIWNRQVGMAREGLSKKVLELFEIPFPPLNEQNRIVAKVDSLMSLCDELEKQQQKKANKKRSLNKASLFALTTSATKQAFNKNWNLITGNFDLLYSTPENVDELKQTILQLAVQGKLTEKWREEQKAQGKTIEPASVLLEKIRREKEKLVREGKIKKQKPLPPITEEEKPFDLPEGWEWCRLGEIISLISGQHLKPEEYNERREGIPYYTGPADFGFENPTPMRWTKEKRATAVNGDILLTVKGAGIGKINMCTDTEAAISRQLMAVRPCLIDKNFLFLYMKTAFIELQKAAVGIAIPGIGRDDVLRRVVGVPSIAEQQGITNKTVVFMSSCDIINDKQNTNYFLSKNYNNTILHAANNSTMFLWGGK